MQQKRGWHLPEHHGVQSLSPCLLVADQIRESTTEPLNSADTHVYALKKPGTNYLAKYALPALRFKQHTPLNSEVEHQLRLP